MPIKGKGGDVNVCLCEYCEEKEQKETVEEGRECVCLYSNVRRDITG